jgi:hypothetical protein
MSYGGRAAPAFWFCRTETCSFSGGKVYPGRGIRYVRTDCRVRLRAPRFTLSTASMRREDTRIPLSLGFAP